MRRLEELGQRLDRGCGDVRHGDVGPRQGAFERLAEPQVDRDVVRARVLGSRLERDRVVVEGDDRLEAELPRRDREHA